MFRCLFRFLQRAQAGANHVLAGKLLDAQEPVAFRQAVGTAERHGLDLAAVRHPNTIHVALLFCREVPEKPYRVLTGRGGSACAACQESGLRSARPNKTVTRG